MIHLDKWRRSLNSRLTSLELRTLSDLVALFVCLGFDDVTLYQPLHDLLQPGREKALKVFLKALGLGRRDILTVTRASSTYLISGWAGRGTV